MFVLEWHRCLKDVTEFKLHVRSLNEQAGHQMMNWCQKHVFMDRRHANMFLAGRKEKQYSQGTSSASAELCTRLSAWSYERQGLYPAVSLAEVWNYANSVHFYATGEGLETDKSRYNAYVYGNHISGGLLFGIYHDTVSE